VEGPVEIIPDYQVRRHYVVNGAPVPPLDQFKWAVLLAFQRWSGARVLIETGTYKGDTTESLRTYFDRVETIEADANLFQAAQWRFASAPNVRVHHGDSGAVLPRILAELSERAVFWLDAHWCGGHTFGEYLSAAVMPELEAIFAHPVKDHVVLIDDARYFCGHYGYPSINQLRRWVMERRPEFTFDIALDSIRIYAPTYGPSQPEGG
jgi:hypothetical protein